MAFAILNCIFLLLCLFVYHVFGRNRLGYLSLFSGVWILICFLGCCNFYDMNQVSDKFYFIIMIGCVSWVSGFVIAKLNNNTYYIKTKFRNHDTKKPEYDINLFVLWIYLGIIIVFLIIIGLRFFEHIKNGFSYLDLHRIAYGDVEDESLFSNTTVMNIYNRVMFPIVLCVLPIGSISILKKGERHLVSILCVIASFIYCLLIGRRFPIFYFALYIVFTLSTYSINIPKKYKKLAIKGTVVVLIAIVLITAWRKNVFETGEWSLVFKNFVSYFNLCLPVGDFWLNYTDQSSNFTYGYGFVYGIISNIDFITRQLGVRFLFFPSLYELNMMPQNNYIYIASGVRSNAFATCFFFFYQDLHYFGVVVGSIIFGYIAGRLERNTFKNLCTINVAFYLLFIQCIFKSFVRWEFYNISYVMAFVFMRLVFKKKNPY